MRPTSDSAFANTNTNWDFWLVANELDSYAERQARQTDRPWGLVFQSDGIRVWVKTWAQLMEDCEHRLNFVQANLEVQSTRDEAVDYLRRTYAHLLPQTMEAQAPLERAASSSAT